VSRTTQRVPFDVTGTLVYHDCPEGRPSSVTSMQVFAWDVADDTALAAIGSGAVESNPNTTLDAAAGVGQTDPRLIPVTATTGFLVGRTYLITAADGNSEWFECLEVDSGNSVTARHPLHNAYASADTVKSTRITATIDPDWVSDEDNLSDPNDPNPGYRVRLVYVVASVTYVRDTYFDLVRYPSGHGVTGLDIDLMMPGWLNRLPTDYKRDQGKRLIDEAHRAVQLDLAAIWRNDAALANAAVTDELVKYKTVELGEWARVMSGGQADNLGVRERYDLATARYADRFKTLVSPLDKQPTRTAAGGAAKRPPATVQRA
jgi:hypothetical protein